MSYRLMCGWRASAAVIVLLALGFLVLLAPGAPAGPMSVSPFSDVQGRIITRDRPGVVPAAAGKTMVLPGDALSLGADYLVATQADFTEDNAGNGGLGDLDPDDAGWDWVLTSPAFQHSAAASPMNIYGETALGLYYAYLATGEASAFTAIKDAADHIVALGTASCRTSSDMIFLMRFNDLPGVSGTAYKDAAKAKFDWRITNQGGTATGFADSLRNTRGIWQGYPNGIIAWDIGAYVVASQMLEARYPSDPFDYADAADDMAEVLWQDSFNNSPGLFDVDDDAGWDPTYGNVNYWWYTNGITGLISAFSTAGDPHGVLPGLVARIAASTYPSGAVSGSYGANTNDEDWQSTAFSTLALAGYSRATYQPQIDAMCSWLAATQDASGGWVYSDNTHYPQVGGENTAALYFSSSVVGPVSPSACITPAQPCAVIPVDVTRGDAAEMRGFSVTFTLSSELVLCPSPGADILQGGYISGGNSQYFVTGSYPTYTVDCALLGEPCGQTASSGTLFTVNVGSAGGDGVGTLTIDAVTLRDCDNGTILVAAGPPATVTIDTAAPIAVTDLVSTQVTSLNDADGTTKIALTFTAPGDAAIVEVYRAPFGNYPEYDDAPGAGAVPATPAYPPGAPWVMTGVTATGQTDEPATRDFWYYVAFTKDACGNVSAVSNETPGELNYHLGDVAAGCAGDNQVTTLDISFLGANYGISLGISDPLGCLDVGPTTDYSVDARPTTDNRVQFEDLMMFAINYGAVSKGTVKPVAEPLDALTVETQPGASGEIIARLVLQGSGRIQGLSAKLAWEGAEPIGMTPGDLIEANGAAAFSSEPGTVDAAVLGRSGGGFTGHGVLATVTFRVTGKPRITLASVVARDADNAEVSLGVVGVIPSAAPKMTELLPAMPNPFNPLTTLGYRLAKAADVELSIFGVDGRRVKVLEQGAKVAGEYRTVWDGTDESGRRLSSGQYFMRLRAADVVHTRMLTLLK
jgi:hypothetical protein